MTTSYVPSPVGRKTPFKLAVTDQYAQSIPGLAATHQPTSKIIGYICELTSGKSIDQPNLRHSVDRVERHALSGERIPDLVV